MINSTRLKCSSAPMLGSRRLSMRTPSMKARWNSDCLNTYRWLCSTYSWSNSTFCSQMTNWFSIFERKQKINLMTRKTSLCNSCSDVSLWARKFFSSCQRRRLCSNRTESTRKQRVRNLRSRLLSSSTCWPYRLSQSLSPPATNAFWQTFCRTLPSLIKRSTRIRTTIIHRHPHPL